MNLTEATIHDEYSHCEYSHLEDRQQKWPISEFQSASQMMVKHP
ncbi:hypothetical protein [Xenorhabdus poinarii]|nr:hypothetical protein [Xenorhabdus poinarii]